MKKTFVLDTSALIYDPSVWKQFPNSQVVLPIAVLSELDNLKKGSSDAARHARVCIRNLDEISNTGDISSGVQLENDTLLKVDATYYDLSDPFFAGLGEKTYGDTKILACLCVHHHYHPEHDVTLVSNDINLRIKAKSRSISAVACEGKKVTLSDLYTGVKTVYDEDIAADLMSSSLGIIDPRCYGLDLNPNECVVFPDSNGDTIALARKVAPDKLKMIKNQYPWGVKPRNNEQSCLMDLMMDRDIDLVTVLGPAGTGKTICTLGAALHLVLERREYEKLVIYRPIQSVGADIGYTPGTVQEKLEPHFAAIMDNFEVLFGNKNGADWKRDLEMYQKKGRIEMGAITYIRGRSIPNSIMIIDECQNITTNDIKTILTRAGSGTKVILSGDTQQIDTAHLDATNNGLTSVVNAFKETDFSAHITLTKGERSRLATVASEIL